MEWKEIEEMYKTAKIPDEIKIYLPKKKLVELTDAEISARRFNKSIFNYFYNAWKNAVDYSENMVRQMYEVKTQFYALRPWYGERMLDKFWESVTNDSFVNYKYV